MSGTQVKTNCFSRSYSDILFMYCYGYDLIKIGEDLIRDTYPETNSGRPYD